MMDDASAARDVGEGAAAPAVAVRSVTKTFGAVRACEDITFHVDHGELLGVLGENGAGKSTIMNILAGLMRPDSGRLAVHGRPVDFRSPRDATDAGIGMVHQHFTLVPDMTVVENVVLGDRRQRPGLLPLEALAERVAHVAAKAGLDIDPWARIDSLGVAQQQRVEIVKALYRDVRILILDEPTAVLSRPDAEKLLAVIGNLARTGVAVILISHKLDDILGVCDRVVVMRRGRLAAERPLSGVDRGTLVRLMVGGDLDVPTRAGRAEAIAHCVCRFQDVTVVRDNGQPAVTNATFDIRAGEIFAFAGVDGNGQRETVEAIAGMRGLEAGSLDVLGDAGTDARAAHRRRRSGLAHVPEDRHAHGILADAPLVDNFLLTRIFDADMARRGVVDWRQARRRVVDAIERYDVKTPGPDARMGTLSGGNQQKLVLGRELGGDPKLLIAAHPTRGLDLKTIAFVQKRLLALRDAGRTVVLVSADLQEIWQLADRLVVFAGGRVVGPVSLEETTTEEVGSWMAGS